VLELLLCSLQQQLQALCLQCAHACKPATERILFCCTGEHYNCTRIYGDRTVSVELKHRPEPYQFKFDCVLPENTSQLEIFEREWAYALYITKAPRALLNAAAVVLCLQQGLLAF
jgi:hypothetical protein